ncbi:MAG: hypothetical protein ACLTZT_02385 [Butyricimonas faecalis]
MVDSPDDFFLYRATWMNYFAANALLARMYMYNGDEENAYKMLVLPMAFINGGLNGQQILIKEVFPI